MIFRKVLKMKFLHGLPSHMHSMEATSILQPTTQTTKNTSVASPTTTTSAKDTITLTPLSKTTATTATTATTPTATTQPTNTQNTINSSKAQATTTTIRPSQSASAIPQAIKNIQGNVSTTGSASANFVPRQQYNDLNVELNKLRAEHRNFGNLINRYKADSVSKDKQILELQKRLDILSSTQNDASKIQRLLNDCEKTAKENTYNLRLLEGKLQEKTATCNQLAQQIDALSQANLGNQANSNVQALLDTCNSQLALLQQQIADLTNRNQALSDENSGLQAQVQTNNMLTNGNSPISNQRFSVRSLSVDALGLNDDGDGFESDLVGNLYLALQQDPLDADSIVNGLRTIDEEIQNLEISNSLKEVKLEDDKVKIANLTKEKDALSSQLGIVQKAQTSSSSDSDAKQKQLEKDLESARLKGNIGLAACGVVLGYATYKYIKTPK